VAAGDVGEGAAKTHSGVTTEAEELLRKEEDVLVAEQCVIDFNTIIEEENKAVDKRARRHTCGHTKTSSVASHTKRRKPCTTCALRWLSARRHTCGHR
jgi:hypothetical protein